MNPGTKVQHMRHPELTGTVMGQDGPYIMVRLTTGEIDRYLSKFWRIAPPKPLTLTSAKIESPWLNEPAVVDALNRFIAGATYRLGCSMNEFKGYCLYLKTKKSFA